MKQALTYIQTITLLQSIRGNKAINWNTGEGIYWTRLTKEEEKAVSFSNGNNWKVL
jgi:hypothetical protein